jgi:ABC-type transporter Mla maintaining outer membrane lipid asymmetry ATPase subunit MlaF
VTSPPVIAIERLVKDYHGLRPLRVTQLTVARGDRVALSGLDATAAEVLVNLVNGAILPDEGEVRVFGRATSAITNETEWFASLDRFGVVTARAVMLEASTVRQNLALPFTIDLDELAPAVREKVERLGREGGVREDLFDVQLPELAPEDRARIHLARAVALDPEVLLLEHPTATVERPHVAAFAQAVAAVARTRRLTVLAITEDTEFADVVATTHYRLHGGTGALVNARGWRRWF